MQNKTENKKIKTKAPHWTWPNWANPRPSRPAPSPPRPKGPAPPRPTSPTRPPLPCSPDRGRNRGRSPPHHLAGDGEDKGASTPRLLGPLSHSPPLSSRPLRLSLPPQIRAAPSFPTPDAVAAVHRRSHGHRTHLAAPRCLQGPPSPAASSGAARWRPEPLQRAHRARLQLRTPATPFFPGADLLLLSLSPASVCRAVSLSPSSPVLSLSRAP